MHVLTIDSSPTQLRKLRNGHAVRIKRGTGFNIVVHPTTYRLASRAFNKDKGITVKLSPDELEANKNVSSQPEQLHNASEVHGEIVGKGIFSSIGKVLKGVAKPLAKFVIPKIAEVGGNMLGNIPVVGGLMKPLIRNVGTLANKAIDGDVGGITGGLKTLATGKGLLDLGYHGGASRRGEGMHHGRGFGFKGMSDLARATRGYADANQARSHMADDAIHARHALSARPSYEMEQFAPRSRGYGIVSHRGNMSHEGYYPPALISQPYSANYQMSHFLPVQYQHFNSSMHEPFSRHSNGQGLYM